MATKTRVGDILLKAKVLDEHQLRSALANYDQWGGRLGKTVCEMGLADEETIAQAIAKATGFVRVQAGQLGRDPAALAKLDAGFCEKAGVFPVQLKDNGKTLLLAMSDPTPLDVVDEVGMRTRARVIPLVATETEIQNAVLRSYRNQDPTAPPDARSRLTARRAIEEPEFSVTQMGKALRPTRNPVREEVDPSELATDPGVPGGLTGGRSAALTAAQGGALLDQLLADVPGPEALSAEDKARVEAVRQNQQTCSKILRAVMELVLEKGALTRAEIQGRLQ